VGDFTRSRLGSFFAAKKSVEGAHSVCDRVVGLRGLRDPKHLVALQKLNEALAACACHCVGATACVINGITVATAFLKSSSLLPFVLQKVIERVRDRIPAPNHRAARFRAHATFGRWR